MTTPDLQRADAPGGSGATALPEYPGAPISSDLVAQIANALFHDVPIGGLPGQNASLSAAPGQPGLSSGPFAPAATTLPSFPEAPLEIGVLAVPDVPGLGGVPIPPLLGTTAYADAVPSVGKHAFLTDVPYEADLGYLTEPGSFLTPQPAASAPQGSVPVGEAEIVGLGLHGLSASGVPAPGETGSAFYFLPSPPVAAPESAAAIDIHAVRNDFPALHQKVHGKPLIWLDNAATTHKPQQVIDAVSYFYAHDNSNIHRGAHTLAARATDAYEAAREKVQRLLGASSTKEIIFTRGTTEAVNLVAQSYGRTFIDPGDEILVSQLEHHSNIVPWQFVAKQTGATLRVIPIDDQGQVLIDAYEQLLGPRTKLVAIAHVSNVLGTVLPIALMTRMAHHYGAKVLVDGAQGAPHLPVNVQAYDADFYVFSGHKIFAPTGIGVLYGKEHILEEMPPWQGGGSMIHSVTFENTTFSPLPAKFEAGTPHISGAVGLGAAIDYVQRLGIERIAAYEEGLMSYATSALATIPGIRQIGTTPGKVGALTFVIPEMRSEELGAFLDREGIAVRAGHHCAQPALARYGLTSAVRPSISLYNTAEEIDALVLAVRKAQQHG